MKTKFQKIQNELSSIFGVSKIEFVKVDDDCFSIRSSKTCMICGVELRKLIVLCDSLDLSYFVRSISVLGNDCVEFVIYC